MWHRVIEGALCLLRLILESTESCSSDSAGGCYAPTASTVIWIRRAALCVAIGILKEPWNSQCSHKCERSIFLFSPCWMMIMMLVGILIRLCWFDCKFCGCLVRLTDAWMTKRPWFLRVRTGNNCQSSDFGRGRCHASSSDPLHAKGLQQPKHCPQHVSDWQDLAKIDRFWQILLLSVVCWVVWQLSPFSRLGPNICDLSPPEEAWEERSFKICKCPFGFGLAMGDMLAMYAGYVGQDFERYFMQWYWFPWNQ